MADDFFTEKKRVRRSFEQAAKTYDQAAVLQHEVSDRMLTRLSYIKHQPDFLLDAGSGTGYASRKLCKLYPHTQIIELDIAHSMLLHARRQQHFWQRFPFFNRPRTNYLCADIEQLPLVSNSINMIWSNLALQWCNQPDLAFQEFNRILQTEGLLMFSTFGPDTLKEMRQAFAGVDSYTHINQFIDMHDLGDSLIRNGFSTPVMDMELITLTYSDIRAAMQDLKMIGAHNATQGRTPGLMGKQRWHNLAKNYERFRQNGRLPATFEVIYGHAWKNSPPPALKESPQIIQFHKKPLHA